MESSLRAALVITAFFVFVFAPYAGANDDATCDRSNNPVMSSGAVGWLAQSAAFLLGARLTPAERKFMDNNPELIGLLGTIRGKAYDISMRLCQVPRKAHPVAYHDEETDAIRHFIAGALLASHLGFNQAKLALLSHEDIERPGPSELMDFNNSQLGVEFGATLYRGERDKITFIQAHVPLIEKRAMELLRESKFTTLKTGRSRCAR